MSKIVRKPRISTSVRFVAAQAEVSEVDAAKALGETGGVVAQAIEILKMRKMSATAEAAVNAVEATVADTTTPETPLEVTPADPASDSKEILAGRPATWDDMIGNERVVASVREAITASKKQNSPMPHTVFFGGPGMGKTTIARLAAAELGGVFFEVGGTVFDSPLDVIRLLDSMNRAFEKTGVPSVLFIDEIHTLGRRGRGVPQESILPLLEDYRFPHGLVGKTWETTFEGMTYKETLDESTFKVHPFTCIGATTDIGMLSPPLLRRFVFQTQLDGYEDEHLAKILASSAKRRGWALDAEASVYLSPYCRRNPGRAQNLLTRARLRAVATDVESITEKVIREVVAAAGLFPLGLVDVDVKILTILANRAPKGVGQSELSGMAGIPVGQYTSLVEPLLRLLGFIETTSRRFITETGIRYLHDIGLANMDNPAVRAALKV